MILYVLPLALGADAPPDPFPLDRLSVELPAVYAEAARIEARFPYTAEKPASGARIVGVRRGTTPIDSPFSLGWDDPKRPTVLVLSAPWSALRGGQHDVDVTWTEQEKPPSAVAKVEAPAAVEAPATRGASADPQPPKTVTHRHTLTIDIPAPTLWHPPTPAWARARLGATTSDVFGLTVAEGTQRAPLRDLSVSWLGPSQPDSAPDVTCTFAGADTVTLAAGAEAEASCTTRGGELGTATGNLRFKSPDLAAPVVVPVTVTTRRHAAVLLAVILLGIGAGWGARTGLGNHVERLKELVAAEDLLTRVRRLAAAAADETYRTALTTLARELEQALPSATTLSLRASLERARTALTAAEDDRKARHDAIVPVLEALERSLRPAWSVPSALRKPLETARAALDRARERLGAVDVAGAAAAVKEAETHASAVREQGVSWARDLRAHPGRTVPTLADLWTALDAHEAALRASDRTNAKVFEALHAAWDPFVLDLAAAVDVVSEGMQAAVVRFVEAKLPAVPAPVGAAPRLAPEKLLGWVQTELVPRHAALSKWAREQAAAREPAEPGFVAAVEAALLTGAWGVVAERLTAAPKKKPGIDSEFLGSGANGTRTDSPTAFVLPSARAAAGASRVDAVGWAAPPFSVTSFLQGGPPGSTREALRNAEILWFVVTGGLVALLGASQLLDGWVGTANDLVEAFAWGLGGDITAGALLTLAKRVGGLEPKAGATGGAAAGGA